MAKKHSITLALEKFVAGGQAIGIDSSGKKTFVWGGLPGEVVEVFIYKSKKDFQEGVVVRVLKQSPERIEPLEPLSYLSTSPWQIVSYEAENKYKKRMLSEIFERAGLPIKNLNFKYDKQQYKYRNKMEYCIWGDENGLSLAHYKRGSHGKVAVSGSALAPDYLNNHAKRLLLAISNENIRAGVLKTIVLRSNQKKETVACVFSKTKNLPRIKKPNGIKGVVVYYSNPKSPASVLTEKLYTIGDITLMDNFNRDIIYDVNSFFQVNNTVFKIALSDINKLFNEDKENQQIIDMYAGVGTIGLNIAAEKIIFVESDELNAKYLKINNNRIKNKIIFSQAEKAYDCIGRKTNLIVDPPRSGLHKKLLNKISEARPRKIIYLSCNPVTQTRDVAELLKKGYTLKQNIGYNFFPRTPHIESLIVLDY